MSKYKVITCEICGKQIKSKALRKYCVKCEKAQYKEKFNVGESKMSIAEINKKAREVGLSYGEYQNYLHKKQEKYNGNNARKI